MGIFSRDPMKAAEADMVSLTTRHEGLKARLAQATARSEAALTEQRKLLVTTDGNDAVAMKKASDACRKTADDQAALEDATRVLGEMVAEARAKVEGERDRIERERVAVERAKQVDRIEAAVAKVDAASHALALAHREMRSEAFAGIDPDPLSGPGSFVGQITALVQHVVLPNAYNPPVEHLDVVAGRYRVTSPIEAAAPMIAALRARIESIRAGQHPAVLPTPYPAPPTPIRIAEAIVFVLQPIAYNGVDNARVEVEAGGHVLPAPVADRAVELKLAFREGSREAAAVARLLSASPSRGIERDADTGEIRRMPIREGGEKDGRPARERIDLGISLYDWIAAERARLVGGSAVSA